MPVPDGTSKIHALLYVGNSTFSSLIAPIGTQGSLSVNSGLVEISPTSGNIYAIVSITSGATSFSITEGSSSFSYTHGATRLVQPNYAFY